MQEDYGDQKLEKTYDPTIRHMDIHTRQRYNYASHELASRQVALKVAGAKPAKK